MPRTRPNGAYSPRKRTLSFTHALRSVS